MVKPALDHRLYLGRDAHSEKVRMDGAVRSCSVLITMAGAAAHTMPA